MARLVFFLIAFTSTVNAAIGTAYVNAFALLWLLPAAASVLLAFWLRPPADIKNVVGLELGFGLDLENPDAPKRVRVTLEDKALNLGFLFIGGPGSGKSVAALCKLVYLSLIRKCGWVYWEGKGDKDIYQKAMACGAVPDKFFSTELPHTDTVNVVSGPTESVIDRLTQVLIVSESDYYRNAQRAALRAVVPLVKSLQKRVILRDLYVVFKNPEAAHYVMTMARQQGVPADVIEVCSQFFAIDEEQRMNDINGLLTRMSLFVTGDIAERLNAYEPTLDLDEAAKSGQRVYLHMPYTIMARDIAIMLTEQIGVIAKHRQLYDSERPPWPQLFDDWGAFFYGNFGPITARCRSAMMPVSFLFQSRGQTDRVDGNRIFTTEITDNIGGMCVFRVNGYESAKWAAEQFGEYETAELSSSENTRASGHSVSTRLAQRVRADTLKNLDSGEAFISCLVSGEGGRSSNKRYKVRFPLPDFSRAKEFDWPQIKENRANNDCEGLHLWRDFMDRDRLAALRREVIDESARTAQNTTTAARTTLSEVDYL